MDIEQAYGHISAAIDAGRPAHGYLVVGDVRGGAMELAERTLAKLFDPEQVRNHSHPDIHWLKPEMKSRVISVEAMHEKLIDPMLLTSYQGGWKAGVIQWADCLNSASANAFLKMLEEPPPKSLFFLLTDAPDSILPTIISRCQRVYLETGGRLRELSEPERSQVLEVLVQDDLDGVTAKAAAAYRLSAILASLKGKAETLVDADIQEAGTGPGEEISDKEYEALVSSRYREFRADFARTLLGWFRDLAAVRAAGEEVPLDNEIHRAVLSRRAEGISLAEAFRNVEAVEELAKSFDRNLKEDTVLFAFTDAVKFGTTGK